MDAEEDEDEKRLTLVAFCRITVAVSVGAAESRKVIRPEREG